MPILKSTLRPIAPKPQTPVQDSNVIAVLIFTSSEIQKVMVLTTDVSTPIGDTISSASYASAYILRGGMKQTYFKELTYSKNYLIQKPGNLYKQYVNAFAFSEMVKSHNKAPNKRELQLQAQDNWRKIKMKDKDTIQNIIFELLHTPIQPSPYPFISQKKTVEPLRPPLTRPSLTPINNLPEPSNNIQLKSNATAQNHLLENLQKVKNDLCKYNNLLRAASTPELRSSFTLKIKKLEETVTVEEKKLKRLRDNAAAQQRTRKKKQKAALEENVVEIYDAPGRPSFFVKDPNLLEKMHDCVEFGAADYK
ncbi:hypothetical protein GLOIN_2v1872053 [Rhizophagus irregularis DAOM 181602=DAOM 197198]|nr:hypothetical protein GLOIN_2v1872053 [Rhizophagus irregularis DAOM 181602=DAOM 197198]